MCIVGFVDGSLQQATQVKWEPAQSEDQHQAEHGFSHFSTLQRERGVRSRSSETLCLLSMCVSVYLFKVFTQGDPQTSLLVSEHLTGHQAVEHRRTGQRNAEVEAKQPPVLRIPVELEHGETNFQKCSTC